MASRLSFALGIEERDKIIKSQQKEIANLYKQWGNELGEMAEDYAKKTTWSASQQRLAVLDLQRRCYEQSKQVSKEVDGTIRRNIHLMADEVCKSNKDWLESLGIEAKGLEGAFRSIPDMAVRNLVTGNVYETGWSLSKAIWSDQQKALHDIYGVVASGLAKNTNIYDIAKQLEAYVDPSKKKAWNLVAPDGVKIFKKSVDYNAQRLARTLVQHTYQQTLLETTRDNPFVTGFIWRANGSRACDLCLGRDGQFYKPEDVPMDHPNGMCVMEPAVDEDAMKKQLIDWFNSPEGTYPEIDDFAESLGAMGDISYQMPKGFKDRVGLYVGGGYSGPESVLNNKDMAYINSHLDEAKNAHFYRVEDSKFTAGQLDLDIKDIDDFNFNGMRSFTKSKNVLKEMLDENSDNYAGIYEPVIFEVQGKAKYFDMKEFTKDYSLMDQQEVLLNGQFEVIGDGLTEVNGEWIRLIKVRQL